MLIALALMVVFGVWTQYAEFYTKVAGLSPGSPPLGAFLALMAVLALGRWAVRRWGFGLEPGEVLVIYAMMLVAVPVMGFGLLHFLFPVLTGESYAAFVGMSKQHQTLLADVPSWFAVADAGAAADFWRGAQGVDPPDGFAATVLFWLKGGVPWAHWWKPLLLAWLPIMLALFVAMLCLGALLRRHWVEAERLPFPQTVMPLAIIAPAVAGAGGGQGAWPRYFGNRIFWIGAAIPAVIHGVNGLHHYYPSIPEIRTVLRLSEVITEEPLSAITSYCNIEFNPLAIGLACLLTFEVGFSFVFFYAVGRFELLWAQIVGWGGFRGKSQFWTSGVFPFFEEQCVGATIALGLIALWMARRHLAGRLRRFGRRAAAADGAEPMSVNASVIGFAAAAVVFVLIVSLARMNVLMAAFIFAMYVCFAIAMAKLRAEGGVGAQPFAEGLFFVLGGTIVFSARSINVFDHFYVMCPGVVMILMGVQMEAWRMCDAVGLRRRSMSAALVLAFVAAFLIGSYTMLTITYRYGMDKMTSYPAFAGKYAFSQLPYDMQSPQAALPAAPEAAPDGIESSPAAEGKAAGPPAVRPGLAWRFLHAADFYKIGAIGFGALVTALLTALRYTIMSWPLHPVGFVMSISRVDQFWSSVLIALCLKRGLLKWGGLRMYETIFPAFVGLIFGDLAMRAFWALVATAGILFAQGLAGYM